MRENLDAATVAILLTCGASEQSGPQLQACPVADRGDSPEVYLALSGCTLPPCESNVVESKTVSLPDGHSCVQECCLEPGLIAPD